MSPSDCPIGRFDALIVILRFLVQNLTDSVLLI